MHLQAPPTARRTGNSGASSAPPLAVVVKPSGRQSPNLRQWLGTHFDHVQAVTIPDVEWDGLAAEGSNPHADEWLRGRLAISLLSRPELIVVACHSGFEPTCGTGQRRKRDVERIVERIRSWDTSTEVIGAWLRGSWDAEASGIESGGLKAEAGPGIAVLIGDGCPQWLAESAWENEGGRVGRARPTGRIQRASNERGGETCPGLAVGTLRALFLDFDPVFPGWPLG